MAGDVFVIEWEDHITGEKGTVVAHSSYAHRTIVSLLRERKIEPRTLHQNDEGFITPSQYPE